MFKRQTCVYDKQRQKELLAHWQDVLGLSNWDIKCKIVRAKEMSLPDSQGTVDYRLDGLEAIIKQLDPIDWDNPDFEQDMENSLVHELLHLVLAPLTEGEGGTEEEQAVNILARALVGLKRQGAQVIQCSKEQMTERGVV